MPNNDTIRRWRRVLFATGAVVTCGMFGVGGLRAQGLDMDSGSAAGAPGVHRSGGLDMDVNPEAPIPPKASSVQAISGGDAKAAVDTAVTQPGGPAAIPQAPTTVAAQPAATPVSAQPAAAPVADRPAAVPIVAQPTAAPFVVQPAAAPAPTTLMAQPATAPVMAQPAAAIGAAQPAQTTVAAQPATAPLAAQPGPVTLDHPTVVDTARLQSGETTVSLYGIEGFTGVSAQGLQVFLASGADRVTCQPQASAGFVCLTADGTNVAQVALVNGAAKASPDAPDSYRQQESAAQDARRGVWANLPPPPATVKHPVVQDTSTLFADGKTYILDSVVGFEAPYSNQLQGYIAANGDSVTCSPQNDADHYICLMPDGTDVAKVALVNGAARVDQDAPDAYRVQQLDALNNRRGFWATASQAVMTEALLPPEPDTEYTLVTGDDGTDGISYVDGAPMALIDGASVFLVYGDDGLGWGYYDHYHHWRGAPDRFRHHMEHFHPGGHGLRGHDAFHHDMGMRGREDAMRRDGGLHGREEAMRRDGAMRGREEAGMRGREDGLRGREDAGRLGGGRPGMDRAMGRPGMERSMARPAMAGAAARPGMAGSMARPAMASAAARPGMGGAMGRPGGMAMAGGRPVGGAPGGFMRPGGGAAMGGGVRPAAMGGGGGMRAAPAMHASAPRGGGGGGGGGKRK